MATSRRSSAERAARQLFLSGTPAWVLRGTVVAERDFDFVNSRYYQRGIGDRTQVNSLISVSRASSGYAADSAGNWESFASGRARITGQGLLIEEAQTNSIRNNSIQGVVAGTPGVLPTNWATTNLNGLATQIVGAGTEDGVDYLDIRFSGMSTGLFAGLQFETTSAVSAISGQTWSNSWFVKLAGGSTANLMPDALYSLGIRELDSRGKPVNDNNTPFSNIPCSPLGLSRAQQTATLSNAGTAFIVPRFILNFVNGAAIDITLRIGWPDLKSAAVVTSPIRTTNTAFMRSADNVLFPLTQAQTIIVSGITAAGVGANDQVICQWDDGSENNRVRVVRNVSRVVHAIVTLGGGQQAALSLGIVDDNTVFKAAFAWSVNDLAAIVDGGMIQTSNSGRIPTSLTTMRLGADSAGNQGNMYLKRLTVFPSRQPDSYLSAAVNS